ncbi:hypothetical protein [Calothrix sp. UHCC 0171]|uniref:hypothetical protein n=1 Tax=Calothrix sp. UHCC 0171 TaxID=3110245 RepID=UPI002B21B866|nr:hypothetical protein [Calothrix sp. UHCC 0171]MEA5569831.1 hypothetical protein [Calothrix sp. UHCC 0171]
MSDSTKSSVISHSQEESTVTSKAFLKNWKTTAIGLTLSFTGFVAFSPSTFGGEQAPIVQVCKYIASGGLAALGLCSKDFNITGGNREQ